MALLGSDDGILAELWTVTHLPNLGLLRRRLRPSTAPARTGAAVFALPFDGPNRFHLPRLKGAIAEGEEVARALK